MARIASPWFWEERQGWYVNKDGRRHFLGEHPADAPAPKKIKGKWNAPASIVQAFHATMAAARLEPKKKVAATTGLTVVVLYDKFLSWCRNNREPLTHRGYHDFIQGFITHLGEKALLPAAELRPHHILEWLEAHPQWGPTRRRNAIIHVQRPYNWAFKLGYIETNPIRHIEKPRASRRENPVTPEDFAAILSKVKDQPFRDLLTFSWETGCRPQEARHIEARHVKLDARRIEIPPAEAKGRKRWRIIRLNDRAIEIVKRLATREGKLFVNTDGTPWKAQAIVCRFQRLKKKLGKAWAAYDFRHGFAEKMLESGADHLSVAELMGHSNGQMIATVYQHLNKADAHLEAALKKASGSQA